MLCGDGGQHYFVLIEARRKTLQENIGSLDFSHKVIFGFNVEIYLLTMNRFSIEDNSLGLLILNQ